MSGGKGTPRYTPADRGFAHVQGSLDLSGDDASRDIIQVGLLQRPAHGACMSSCSYRSRHISTRDGVRAANAQTIGFARATHRSSATINSLQALYTSHSTRAQTVRAQATGISLAAPTIQITARGPVQVRVSSVRIITHANHWCHAHERQTRHAAHTNKWHARHTADAHELHALHRHHHAAHTGSNGGHVCHISNSTRWSSSVIGWNAGLPESSGFWSFDTLATLVLSIL
mmetsp:Transcript_74085/g.171843  ORF Transcript_74085/g.171843 Transcript_74085/m.171843 type:complete len:230 (+) Transcript_74085:305-994(+)